MAETAPLAAAVCGATGATGSLVVQEILASPHMQLAGAGAAPGEPASGAELSPGVAVVAAPGEGIRAADVVIDFSAPPALDALLDALEARPVPAVVGTTGLSAAQRARLARFAEVRPVVFAPNVGLGINVLRRLVKQAAEAVGGSWDAEIVEVHHRRKKDAPSGTALALAADVAGVLDRDADRDLVLERAGDVGARTDAEIGVQALRGGDVVGEHTVMLLGQGERIELIHRATDRTTFAAGAVRAARWVCAAERAPGLYSMDDVLFGSADDR